MIASTRRLFSSKPLIYFSGGKESAVLAELFRTLGGPCNLLCVLPGMDQPDDVEYFKKEWEPYLEANKNFQLFIREEDPEKFFKMAKEKGRLSAGKPWCRTELKMPLKHRSTREIYGENQFVAYEGSRKYETNYRRRFPIVHRPANYHNQLWVHPISFWTELDVWMYTQLKGLKVSPIYAKGFDKTTCWCCPLVHPFQMECSRREYPELWERLGELDLVGFADRIDNAVPF